MDEAEFAARVEAADVPGAVVALARGRGPVSVFVAGVRDRKTRVPVDEQTVFQAASLSKPLFAYAVLHLSAQGGFDLDLPIVPLAAAGVPATFTIQARDAAGAMLAKEHAALGVYGETVRALIGRRRVGAAGFQEDGGHRVSFDPLVGNVVRHVGEDNTALIPHRAFGPRVAAIRDRLDLGVARDQRIERRVKFLDGLLRAVGGQRSKDGKEEGGEELHG
jgi:hypothetical protein